MAFGQRGITKTRLYDLLEPFFHGDVTGRYTGSWIDPYDKGSFLDDWYDPTTWHTTRKGHGGHKDWEISDLITTVAPPDERQDASGNPIQDIAQLGIDWAGETVREIGSNLQTLLKDIFDIPYVENVGAGFHSGGLVMTEGDELWESLTAGNYGEAGKDFIKTYTNPLQECSHVKHGSGLNKCLHDQMMKGGYMLLDEDLQNELDYYSDICREEARIYSWAGRKRYNRKYKSCMDQSEHVNQDLSERIRNPENWGFDVSSLAEEGNWADKANIEGQFSKYFKAYDPDREEKISDSLERTMAMYSRGGAEILDTHHKDVAASNIVSGMMNEERQRYVDLYNMGGQRLVDLGIDNILAEREKWSDNLYDMVATLSEQNAFEGDV
tara:strand:- start:109 stop:1254 length:1146 start_codon:yes stop_codon:yes gene_type:complete